MAGSELCGVERARGNGVGGLIQMADHAGEQSDQIRGDRAFYVLRAVALSDQLRVGELVEGLLFDADGERLERLGRGLGHQGDDHARIHAAAEQSSDRNIAHQVGGDGAGQALM